MAQFTVVASAITAGAARDLVALAAPAGKRLMIRSILVTPDATNTEHALYELYTAAAGAVTGGTALTARCAEAYETTYNGSAVSLPNAVTKTPTQPLHREGLPFTSGFRWVEDQQARQLWLGSGEALVIRQAFTTAVASSVTIAFDEVD